MQLINPEQYEDVLNFTKNNLPSTALIHLWFEIRVKHFDQSPLETFCFVDIWPNPNVICSIAKIPQFYEFKNCPMIYLWSRMDDEQILKCLDDLNQRIKITNSGGMFCGLPECRLPIIEKFIGDKRKYKTSFHCPFWIPTEKRNILTQNEIQPPSGYYFDKLKCEEAKFVDDTWAHKFPGSLSRMEFRISHLPNVALRLHGTGELVSFEVLNDENGFMTHLYTLEKHRRKGLATKVEEKLAQLLIIENILPLKFVGKTNAVGQAITENSPWWDTLGYTCVFVRFLSDSDK